MLCSVCLCLPSMTYAQWKAEARLDSNHLLIGDQTNLYISCQGPATYVHLPQACDTCLHGLEIVARSPIDTQIEEGNTTIRMTWTLTAFDSGRYEVPSLVFFDKDSQMLASTPPLTLEVQTLEVDTNAAIKDIKNILQAPLTFKEIMKYGLMGLAAAAIIVALIWLIVFKMKKKQPQNTRRSKPKEPAHIIALRDLESLRQKKLWQNGEHKSYYSELTDILRTYLYNRWDISAMEMVSDEIMQALEQQPEINRQHRNCLQSLLRTADAVKFAKACPMAEENTLAFESVYHLVEETKVVDKEKETEKEGDSDE